MTQMEIEQRALQIGFWFESTICMLEEKGMIESGFAQDHRKRFYGALGTEKELYSCKNQEFEKAIRYCFRMLENGGTYISLTDIAKKYSSKQPGYIIQSWMRDRGTLEFLRIWELINNYSFRDNQCAELIENCMHNKINVTPTLWVKTTGAMGIKVKRGKGGGVIAHSDIAFDFRMWLDPNYRYHLLCFVRCMLETSK